MQDVLSEIQQDAARIADQLSGALPARQSPTWLPADCVHPKPRDDVNLPDQPVSHHAHAPRQAQEQPVASIAAAANHPSGTADPMAQSHQGALAGENPSGDAYSGPQQGSAESASMVTPLVECDIDAPGLRGSRNTQEQDQAEQQQHWHGHNAMGARCNAALAAPPAALGGSGDVKIRSATEKSDFARHSWPGAVQRVVRSVFSLGTARLAPLQQIPGKSRQPAASNLQTCVAVGVKKAQAKVESAAEGVEEAQKEGMQAGIDGRGGQSKILGAEVVPYIPQMQPSGHPTSSPQSSDEQCLSGAGQRMENTTDAADPVTESEHDLIEAMTAAVDSSEMEAAKALVSITHSQADTMEAMQPAIATQLAMPTDFHLSEPHACNSAPRPPSPQRSQLLLDFKAPAGRPINIGQQPPFASRAGGEGSEAAPLAMAAAAAAAEAPRLDERGASRKRVNEDGKSTAWSWALEVLPIKRAKTTSDVITEQV